MTRPRHAAVLTLAILACGAWPALAQIDEPIGRYVADARITWARFKEDAALASAIGVNTVNLPTRGLGIVLGAHWYPLRGARMALGVGGEILAARDHRTLAAATEDGPEGPTVDTRLSAVSPQVSINFGRRNGWSYISGGLGSAAFTAERRDAPVGAGSRARTINYGGGARWFTRKRLAVSVDLRFYSVAAQPSAAARPAYPKSKMMVISGGIAVR